MAENEELEESVENFDGIKNTNWSKSSFMRSAKYFTVVECSEQHKLVCRCELCPKASATLIRADPSSCGNLRTHISVRYTDIYLILI